MTPRKPKQRQQQHHHRASSTHHAQTQVSDYDSDVLMYNMNQSHAIPPATRTNMELNLSVLRRHNPIVRNVLSIAANAVIYLFSPNLQQWEKSGIEGTMFVCDTESSSTTRTLGGGEEGYCIIILNRHGLSNLTLDLRDVEDVEIASDLLSIRFLERDGEAQVQKVMGIWIHADKDDTREVNATLIQQCWEKAATSKARHGEQVQSAELNRIGAVPNDNAITPESAGTRRRISLSDLFRQQSSQ